MKNRIAENYGGRMRASAERSVLKRVKNPAEAGRGGRTGGGRGEVTTRGGGTPGRYEFLRIGGHPELLRSSRREGDSCLSSVEGPTWL